MNDLEKPIVAQIYRLWQDEAGKKWINTCWYYRPEQTIHRVTKRFYRSEVMKTGQYRDHRIEDIVDRCFVMFHTRYHRGRPRGLPIGKEVYVCEARYNEEKFTFNRIKTWTSCLPDEVREKDYEMDLFDVPRKVKKDPTPIAHLLNENAKETDSMPKPNWGHKDAPPIIGGVHIRPREPNVSQVPDSLLSIYSQVACWSASNSPATKTHLRRVRVVPLPLCLACLEQANGESSRGSRVLGSATISLSCQTRLIWLFTPPSTPLPCTTNFSRVIPALGRLNTA
jgi:chromatin structure-remodeling complex subunit RSC1/2